jgi:hypothetical protein
MTMSDRWNQYSDEEKQMAEAAFSALSLRDPLREPGEADESHRRFGLSDLYAYVKDPAYDPGPDFAAALEREPRLRGNLDHLLEHGAICRFGLAEVASTGTIEHREEGPYSIHLQESHAIEGRIIVVIELSESAEATPATIFAQRPDGRCYKLTLPEAQNARIQLLVDEDSAMVAALRDPNATVILR